MQLTFSSQSLQFSELYPPPAATQTSPKFVGKTLLEWTEGIVKQEEAMYIAVKIQYSKCQTLCNAKNAFVYPILI